MRQNIKKSFTLGIIILSILFMALISGVVYYKSKNAIDKLEIENELEVSTQRAVVASNIISEKSNYRQMISALQTYVNRLVQDEDKIEYAVVIDSAHVKAIAHSDKQKLGKVYDDDYTVSAATKGEVKYMSFYADVQKKQVWDMMVPIYVNGKQYAALDLGIDPASIKANGMSTILSIMKFMFIVFLVIILVVIVSVGKMVDFLLKPLYVTTKFINKLADLDFRDETLNMIKPYLKRKDVLGQIGNALINMSESIKKFVSQSQNASDFLLNKSTEFEKLTSKTLEMSNNVSSTVEEIARGATNQADDTQKGASSMNEISNSIKHSYDLTEIIEKSTQDVIEAKNQGFEAMKKVVESTTRSSEALNKINEIMIANEKSVNDIKNASDMINKIAEQTNLLALNASIESARAGEAGKGFAVVAGEIGKLAEDTKGFTNQIVEMIEILINSTQNAVESVSESENISKEQLTYVNNASNKFEEIAQAIDETENQIANLTSSFGSLDRENKNMNTIIENLSAVSEEYAASTEETTANIQSQISLVDQISESSKEMQKLAKDLDELTSKFAF